MQRHTNNPIAAGGRLEIFIRARLSRLLVLKHGRDWRVHVQKLIWLGDLRLTHFRTRSAQNASNASDQLEGSGTGVNSKLGPTYAAERKLPDSTGKPKGASNT